MKASAYILVFSFLIFPLLSPENRTPSLPENPLNGSSVFIAKGCAQCHQMLGVGESFGPDLTTIGQEKDFFDLAGAMWSHSPKMIEVMIEKNIPRPVLSPQEMEELIAYLYYLGSLEEQGNYLAGEKIFSSKNCSRCHSLGNSRIKNKIPLDRYGRYASPVVMATALWNHSSSISPLMLSPGFSAEEMGDLLAYIRGNAQNEKGETIYLQPGNPQKGREIFQKKQCGLCHGREAQNLIKNPLRKGLTEIVANMWSHSFSMWEEMKKRGINRPSFTEKEMADLLSYLYFVPYYGEKGDKIKGGKIFSQKGCSLCHSRQTEKEKRGVDLTEFSSRSVSEIIAAMWNHVPEMEKMVTESSLPWPRFEKGEMKDLIYYLQSWK